MDNPLFKKAKDVGFYEPKGNPEIPIKGYYPEARGFDDETGTVESTAKKASDEEYYQKKLNSEIEQVVLDHIRQLYSTLRLARLQNDGATYARAHAEATELIQEYPAVREWAQEHMVGLPSPKFVGLSKSEMNKVKRERRKGIEDAVKTYQQNPAIKLHAPTKPLDKIPEFSEEDMKMLKTFGIQGSVKAAWDKAYSKGIVKLEAGRYVFDKSASANVRLALSPVVASFNKKLARRHIPKNAAAHEAAIKEIAKVVSAGNAKLERVYKAVTAGRQPVPHLVKYSEDDLNYLLDSFSNMLHTNLSPDIRKRLIRVINNPNEKNWENAYSIIINPKSMRMGTLWQSCIAVDPTVPRSGRVTDRDGHTIENWSSIPSQKTIVKALLSVAGLNSMPKKPTLEEPFSQEDKDSFLKSMGITGAAKKPSCPECGSTDYGLMPTDFETAKCNKCGKNWDHGIVKGINDPSDKTSASKKAAIATPPDIPLAYSEQVESGATLPEVDEIHYIYYAPEPEDEGDSDYYNVVGFKDGEGLFSGNVPAGRLKDVVGEHLAQQMALNQGQVIRDRALPGGYTLTGVTRPYRRLIVHDREFNEMDKQWLKEMHIASKKTAYMTDKEKAEYTRLQMDKLRDGHELNQRLDDHLEAKTCAGCGEQFYANRNDGDYCCYEHSDGHWHGDPDKAGAEQIAFKHKSHVKASVASTFFNALQSLNKAKGA